ncbi:MAG TPA: sulfite exporter TauE/SafE family protein, partial [Micromonosporaceae bacterium]|nr:sulfite exporter TauE/SafE family protein [Micromonosporaceae bacterium]
MALPTALALGAAIGLFLGALGGGGSILTVPALVYLLHEPARAATTESLVIVGVTALIAAVAHARAGRVRWAAGLAFGAVGMAASIAGTAANRAADPTALLLAFAGLTAVAATAMLGRRHARPTTPAAGPEPAPVPEHAAAPPVRSVTAGGVLVAEAPASAGVTVAVPPTGRGRLLRLVTVAIGVGFLTGFFGAGGGFVIVPALVMVLGFPMPAAVGTSLVVIALDSAAALAGRAGGATFHWAVIVPFTVAAVASSLAGKRVADRLRPDLLTRAFAALLFAVAA